MVVKFVRGFSVENAIGLGVEYMFVGMTVVFLFLVLMIIVMNMSSKILSKLAVYFPEESPEEHKGIKQTDRAKIAAVIAIAKAQAN